MKSIITRKESFSLHLVKEVRDELHRVGKHSLKTAVFLLSALFLLPTCFSTAQTPIAEPLDMGALAALHTLVESDSPAFSLYSVLAQTGALGRIMRQVTTLERPPDCYLLFDGARQHQSYCLAEPKTNLEMTNVPQGTVLCALTLDDNVAEHYMLNVEYRRNGETEWRSAERITSLFSTGERKIVPLVSEPVPNIPYYVIGAEFFRVEPPCDIRIEVEPLPGESLPRKYFGWGVGGGFILQDKANLRFTADTVTSLPYDGTEISGNGLLNINIFPGRDAFRWYSPAFWKKDFYRDFFRRWSLQAGLAFTRSNQLLQHYAVGAGFRLLGFLDITGTMLFTSRPKENIRSVVSPADHIRADQVIEQTRKQYFMLGININIMEF